jgi:hypothetical protein
MSKRSKIFEFFRRRLRSKVQPQMDTDRHCFLLPQKMGGKSGYQGAGYQGAGYQEVSELVNG